MLGKKASYLIMTDSASHFDSARHFDTVCLVALLCWPTDSRLNDFRRKVVAPQQWANGLKLIGSDFCLENFFCQKIEFFG